MTFLAILSGSIGLFAASMAPFLLLVDADHLVPRPVRSLPLSAAALLLIVGGPRV
ncbi:hypothetical protein [Streptomyces sp. 900116325]